MSWDIVTQSIAVVEVTDNKCLNDKSSSFFIHELTKFGNTFNIYEALRSMFNFTDMVAYRYSLFNEAEIWHSYHSGGCGC